MKRNSIKTVGATSRFPVFLFAFFAVQLLRLLSASAPHATHPRTLQEMQVIKTAGTVRT